MKRILILSLTYYPKFIGGAEVAIKEITDRIDPNEYSFDMVTLRFNSNLPEVEKIGNVTIHRIGFTVEGATIADLGRFPLFLNKIYFQFAGAFKAFSLHKKNSYDALWAMMAHSSGVPAAIFKYLAPNVPYILTLQEGDPTDYIQAKMLPLYPLFIQAFRKADIIQAISTFLGKWSRDMGFKGNLEIIPNGVNTKFFSQEYSEDDLQALEQKIGIKEDDICLITTSRLVQKNAINDVIASLSFLPSSIKFLIVGSGPDEEKLRRFAKEKGVESRVKFLGYQGLGEIPKYLKISDIFIRPSLSEGMGNSFVEAMAAGIPIIATQEGGITDFLFDPKRNPDKKSTGRAVNPKDPKSIAEAVEKYIHDKNTTAQIIKNAKELIFSKYDWNLVAKNMKERVFDAVIKR
jgi:glycosyltransferase involved in cell wall biosynthesis